MAKNYAIVIEKRAERELRKLPADVRPRIARTIASLAENPSPSGVRELVARRGDSWRIRVGHYRVVYDIKDEMLRVFVVRIAHRREAYD